MNTERVKYNLVHFFRLDFIEFDLTPPRLTEVDGNLGNMIYLCTDDKFYVIPGFGIPPLCGYNRDQHSKYNIADIKYGTTRFKNSTVYVHVPSGISNISLHVRIGINDNRFPTWNIKVTQLLCPTSDARVKQTVTGLEDFLSLGKEK